MLQLYPVPNIISGHVNLHSESSSAAMKSKPTTSFLIADILDDIDPRDSGDTMQSVSNFNCFITHSNSSSSSQRQRGDRGSPAAVVRPWEQRKTSRGSGASRRNQDRCNSHNDDELRSLPEMVRCGRVLGLHPSASHFRSLSSMATATAVAASMILNHPGTMFTRSNTLDGVSPLSALYRMTNNNFDSAAAGEGLLAESGVEGGIDAALQQCVDLGKPAVLGSNQFSGNIRSRYNQNPTLGSTSSVSEASGGKKRRKSRTAFTGHQLRELERRFARQKYLLPADRDSTARDLGLTNAQVITWFQNRRAKLKRDLDELRADVDAARSLGSGASACGDGEPAAEYTHEVASSSAVQ